MIAKPGDWLIVPADVRLLATDQLEYDESNDAPGSTPPITHRPSARETA